MISCYSKDRGFTLLELLIAMSMLVVVLTAVYGSYQSSLTRNPSMENDNQSQEMVRTCLNQMLSDLSAVYVLSVREYHPLQASAPPNPYGVFAETLSVGNKTFSRLRFSSLFHLRLDYGRHQDIAHIVYYVQQLPDGSFVLRRSESFFPYPPFQENPADPVLCKNIRTLNYVFYDSKGQTYQTWDSDSSDQGRKTPTAVHITMESAPMEGTVIKMETSLVFPVFRAGT